MSIWVALGSLVGAIWGPFLTLLEPKGPFGTKNEGQKRGPKNSQKREMQERVGARPPGPLLVTNNHPQGLK